MIGCVILASILVALYVARQAGTDDATVVKAGGNRSTQREGMRSADRVEGMRATRTTRPGQSLRRETNTDDAVMNPLEDEEGDGRPIYTMENLPKESGIYRVQVDGELLELAVDQPHDVVPTKQEVAR